MSEAESSKGKGCFFYGCITAIVLVIVAVAGTYFGARYMMRAYVNKYTETTAVPLPKVTVLPQDLQNLRDRVKKFKDALDQGKPAEPLVLTANDLNAMIADEPNLAPLKDAVVIGITNDQVTGQISLPLDRVNRWNLSFMQGRYLNGQAALKLGLTNGTLAVTLQSLKAKGVNLPPEALVKFQNLNLAKDVNTNPKSTEFFNKFESIEVKDGKVIIQPKEPAKAPEPAK